MPLIIIKKAIVAFIIIILIDIPWLTLQLSASQKMFSDIQGGRAVHMTLWPAIIVYIALAYLLLLQSSASGAFLSGASVYAVYDFTNMTVFKDYSLTFAIADTLWGGVLFYIAYLLMKHIFP
jgi:uncharacterized membrane protein